jgi:Protein of unknown function (DUF1440)
MRLQCGRVVRLNDPWQLSGSIGFFGDHTVAGRDCMRSERKSPLNMTLSRSSASSRMTPLAALIRGALAGAVGTAAFDTFLFVRYRRGGGESHFGAWESSAGLGAWEQAPAPALVGKRLLEGLFDIDLAPSRARLLNNATHWAFGVVAGVQYGIVAGSLRKQHVFYGLPFGATVWASGYVVLPAMKLYKPIWTYDRKTLANDLSGHLVYGLATAAGFRALSR